jgi:hypothetical protein
VVVEEDGVSLETVAVSDNPPTVEATNPNGGENLIGAKTITWTGSDSAGDNLAYAVLCRNDDGLNWCTLAIDHTVTTLSWDTDEDSGASGSGRIKVMVSDGYLTAVDISDAAFSLGNKVPATGVDWLPLFPGKVTIYVLITDAVPAESNVTNNLATVEIEVAECKVKVQLPIILRE